MSLFEQLMPLIYLVTLGGIPFGIQLFLCFKVKHKIIKRIPLYLILLGYLYCILEYSGIFGSYSAGALPGNELAAVLVGILLSIVFVGVTSAWIIYLFKIYYLNKRK